MPPTFKRYNSIRRADNVDDQQGSGTIIGALTSSVTQEQLQVFYLSRLRQIIYGETSPEHWFDDFLGSGILPLKTLSLGIGSLVRIGVPLVGPLDGANRIFRTTPDFFVHDIGGTGKTIELWHNGRRLIQTPVPSPEAGDYTVEESGGVGTGFDTINLLTFAPVVSSSFVADYQRT